MNPTIVRAGASEGGHWDGMPTNDNYLGYMTADLRQYVGEWVAICGGKVVSHDPSIKKAYEEAKRLCHSKRPLLTMVPEEDNMIF
jgi:hypothetical protein